MERREQEFDYGLGPGERFEPDELDEPFDPAAPHIMTALGPIDPGALGLTLPHEHVIRVAVPGAPVEPGHLLDDPAAAASELEEAGYVGLRAIVSVDTPETGRDAGLLTWAAQRAPVHVIIATGSHHPDGKVTADLMVAEMLDGIGGTGARAGLVVAGAGDAGWVAAVAEAQRRTGAAVLLPPALVARQERWAGMLIRAGIAPDRIAAWLPPGTEPDLLPVLHALGIWVGFTGVGAGDAAHDRTVAEWIAGLYAAGDGAPPRVLASGDLSRRSQMRAYEGTPGWLGFLEWFPLLLMEAGLPAMQVRAVVSDNPATWLAMARPGGERGQA